MIRHDKAVSVYALFQARIGHKSDIRAMWDCSPVLACVARVMINLPIKTWKWLRRKGPPDATGTSLF